MIGNSKDPNDPVRRQRVVLVAVDLIDGSGDWCVRCGSTDVLSDLKAYVGIIHDDGTSKETSAGTFTCICAPCQFSFVNWFMDSDTLKLAMKDMPAEVQDLYHKMRSIVGSS